MGCASSKEANPPGQPKAGLVKPAQQQPEQQGTTNAQSQKAAEGNIGYADAFTGVVGPLSVREYQERLSCPEATQVWKLPKSGYTIKYVCVSLRGYYPENPYKANQDSFCAIPGFGGDPDTLFFGVFDGHGEFGTEISNYARDQVPMRLVSDEDFGSTLESAVVNSFVDTNEALHQSEIDDTMSGTTAIAILLRADDMYVANVGDSRAFIAEVDPETGEALVAEDLSHDQTPYRRDECERVRRAGATVMTLDQLEGLKNPKLDCWTTEMEDDGDPPRLWLPNAMFPGTAFTRSIGDSVAERIGVVAVPEICLKKITNRSRFAVIASDGVFEFLASQNVADIISRFDDPLDGARAVVSESYRLWLENEMRTDDITIIVVAFCEVPEEVPNSRAGNGAAPTPVISATFIEPQRSTQVGGEGDRDEPEPIRSPEEIEALDRAMRANFLFANLSDDQRRSIYGRMQRHVFYPGDIVIRQGDRGDNFYVVKDGILDVYISQGEGNSALVHTYKASDGFHPSFGELALMHGKPRAATVVARTKCVLWSLDREGFRSVVQRHAPTWLIQLLQGVDCLRPLKYSQLELMVNFMEELAYEDGEVIVRQGDEGDAFYIITHGEVVVTIQRSGDEEPKQVLALGVHQYFGEKALSSSARRAASVVARGFVRLLYITRSTFERVLGPLTDLEVDRQIWEENSRALAERRRSDVAGPLPASAEELTPAGTLLMAPSYALIRCQVGTEHYMARVTSIADVATLNLSEQVLRSRAVTRSVNDSLPSPLIPPVVRVFKDSRMIVELMQCDAVCTLGHLVRSGAEIGEEAARYVAACTAVALDHVHRSQAVYRSLCLDSLAFTAKGQVQVVDYRYARPLDAHCYSMTGVPEFIAPEMVEQKGYTEAADWWALGVLVYTLLVGRTPFAQPGENELQVYRNITAGALSVPPGVSPEAASLIQALIVREPMQRLGVQGMRALRQHPWFRSISWDRVESGTLAPPRQLADAVAAFKGLDNRQFIMAEGRAGLDTAWVDKF